MKYIKNPKIRHHIDGWIGGWINLIHSLILILSLGFIYTGWDFEWAYRCVKKGSKISKYKRGLDGSKIS